MEPLEVFALDRRFDRLTGSLPYTSLRWVRRFTKSGEFELVVPADVYSPEWAYVYTDERPETGIVQKVEHTDSSQAAGGIDTVTVSGLFLESLLDNITFLVEQPETKSEKVYVERPHPPYRYNDTLPQVYRDPATGRYVYSNRQGEAIDQDGRRVDWSSSYERVDYGGAWQLQTPGADQSMSYVGTGAYTTDGGKTVTQTAVKGGAVESTETHDVLFKDDRGDHFYLDSSGRLMVTTGVADRVGDTYTAELLGWSSLPSDDGGHYYTRTWQVKGPWQRTEMLEPTAVADPVQTVYRWAQRFMGAAMLYVEPDFSGTPKALDPSLKRLGEVTYETLNAEGASFRVDYDFTHNAMTFRAYRGLDRTQAQSGLPWAVFSDTWGTLRGWTASRDTSNYRNTCYVLYEFDEPKGYDEQGYPLSEELWHIEWDESGNFSRRVHDGWRVPYERRAGYHVVTVGDASEQARETYLDKRNEPPECDSEWQREAYSGEARPAFERPVREIYERYPDAIKAEAKQTLERDHGVITTLETGTVDRDAYLRDFDLGDLVEVVLESIGVSERARVTEVEETYEAGRADVTITVGDQLLTWAQKARLV